MKLQYTLIIIVIFLNLNCLITLNLRSSENKLERIVTELKSKLPDNLQDNNKFNTENVFRVIQALLSGDIKLSNLSVSKASEFNTLTINNQIDAHSQATFSDELNVNKVMKIGNSVSIVNNTLLLEPNTEIKIDSFPMKYKASDLFEMVSFMKYIKNQCKDEKGNFVQCDFTLLKKKNS